MSHVTRQGAVVVEPIWLGQLEPWFSLMKNGKRFARLGPDHEKHCSGRQLAELLARAELSAEECSACHCDSMPACEPLKAPNDKWG